MFVLDGNSCFSFVVVKKKTKGKGEREKIIFILFPLTLLSYLNGTASLLAVTGDGQKQ
jgi:hypothetical protein